MRRIGSSYPSDQKISYKHESGLQMISLCTYDQVKLNKDFKEHAKRITKFNSHAISSSMEITIADAPAFLNSDLKHESFDDTSTPAHFRSCNLIGSFGGFGLDSFQISSTRLKSYNKTNSWFPFEMSSLNSFAASDEKRNCLLHQNKEN